ncbi:Arylsulfatase A [Chitinophaga jiangningensis]|uniref:Arylsulfatase A n=1 Tax=Chitinophaga jiangningensis TaxID=1419482 RepID=A0A1M7JWD2_9BACT|nr:sulfatase [Chitinophaga jiangningensis]SHM57372.1 Arylsulfatase A [Chitinophaga jiangningensis]
MRRHLFMSLALLGSTCTVSKLQAQQRPNIVIILSDDHAFQTISAYGSKLASTPGIDRIAKEGVRFDKAYVTNSICGPSRATIITGKYSHKNGFKDNDHSVFDGSQNTFVKELNRAGYQTAWIGKWHLESKPEGFTFYKILPGQGQYYNPDFLEMNGKTTRTEGYVTNIIEDEAEKWLSSRDTTQPFCLVIGHKATHRNWIPDTTDMGTLENRTYPVPSTYFDDYNSRDAAKQQEMSVIKDMTMAYDLKMLSYDKNIDGTIKRMNAAQRAKFDAVYQPIEADLKAKKLSGKALAEWKYQRYMRDYLATAQALDRNINRTLNYLDAHHLSKNTIVIYMSDQGFYMGEHGWFDKRWMYEESFRTPMVMRYPGVVKPGTVANQMVLNMDIAPTMLEAARVKVPADMQGQSMLPLLKAPKSTGRDVLYYHYYENTVHAVSPHFGIKTPRYKLIRYYERVDGWELFDLQTDPHELHNLYNDHHYTKQIADLKALLKQQIIKYDDQEALQIAFGKK